MAPEDGCCEIDGVLTDADKVTYDVGGDDEICICTPEPTPTPGEASATRTLPDCADKNTEFTVTVDASNYGGFGQITETLCDGWTYVSSSLPAYQVDVNGNQVTFTLVGDTSFTYTIMAPEDGCCEIDGVLTDADKVTYDVGGDDEICICTPYRPQPDITEPEDGTTVSGTITITETNTGTSEAVYNLFRYYADTNGNCIADDGSSWEIIGNDTDGSDGWSVVWDTKAVADGSYIIDATMGDVNGTTNTDQICVLASNPPEVEITSPGDGAKVKDFVTVEAEDNSGQNDVISTTFEYSSDGLVWTTIGTDTDGSDGWSVVWDTSSLDMGSYLIKATMTDTIGNTGSDQITVTVVPEGIVLYPGWNFISVYYVLDNSSVDYVLDGVTYDAITYWNACSGTWEAVDSIEPLKGYWIKVSSMQTIVNIEHGPGTPPSIPLCEGWNAIGTPVGTSMDAETIFLNVTLDEDYDVLWKWDAATQDYNLYGYNCNVFTEPSCPLFPGTSDEHVTTEEFVMDPFLGYWMNVVNAAELSAPEG
jgi:hypothetical protein